MPLGPPLRIGKSEIARWGPHRCSDVALGLDSWWGRRALVPYCRSKSMTYMFPPPLQPKAACSRDRVLQPSGLPRLGYHARWLRYADVCPVERSSQRLPGFPFVVVAAVFLGMAEVPLLQEGMTAEHDSVYFFLTEGNANRQHWQEERVAR